MSERPNAAVRCAARLATSSSPGAIAVIHLTGEIDPVLTTLTDRAHLPLRQPVLCRINDIDTGIIIRWSDASAMLMPHGGPRITQRILVRLSDQGVEVGMDQAPQAMFPEADSAIEALCLGAVSRLSGDLGLELLLDQPRRWNTLPQVGPEDRSRAARLDRLFTAPLVVVCGPPNVGKSTLSNRLLGRPMSVAADLHGTTRDYVAARISLNGLVVRWTDTPGLRSTDDPIERAAQHRADALIEQADLLVAMTDHRSGWPDTGRHPDVRVANKSDLATRIDVDFNISATTGDCLVHLVNALRECLVPDDDLTHPGPWLFDERCLTEATQMPIAE